MPFYSAFPVDVREDGRDQPSIGDELLKDQSRYWQFGLSPIMASIPPAKDLGSEDAAMGAGRAKPVGEPERSVLFVANPGTISQPLIDALRRELPFLVVESVSNLSSALAAFSNPISLILAEWDLLRDVERALVLLADGHPTATIALIETNAPLDRQTWGAAVGSDLIRGVVPMNIKLDVWLSIIHLMVRGGEYFPARVFDVSEGPRQAAAEDPAPSPQPFASLTPRERQILDLVSRGYQNKAIAADLRLSESTVKVHIHNVIGKLGAQNRTEAATLFRIHLGTMLRHDT